MPETTTVTEIPSVFPICLDTGVAYNLVMKYAERDFYERERCLSGQVEFDFSATLYENGDVKISVRYDQDTGWMKSCGPMFSPKTIRPYDDEQIKRIVSNRKFEIAEREFDAREALQRLLAIRKIQAEIFGEEPENV